MAEKIIKFTRTNSKIVFKPLPEDDPNRRQPDISMAKALIKWKPDVALDAGLRSTIYYFREMLSGENKHLRSIISFAAANAN